jgi:hypothetical protein
VYADTHFFLHIFFPACRVFFVPLHPIRHQKRQ